MSDIELSLMLTQNEINSASKALKLAKALGRRIPEFEPIVLKNMKVAIKYFDRVFGNNEKWPEFISKHGSNMTDEQLVDYVAKAKVPLPEYEQIIWDTGLTDVTSKPNHLPSSIRYAWTVGRVPLYESLFNNIERTDIHGKLLFMYLDYVCHSLKITKTSSLLNQFIKTWETGDNLDFDVTFTQLASR